MLVDHANDLNHKKMLGITSSLCRLYRNAVDMLDHARTYYQNLTDEAGNLAVDKWTQDIETAEVERKIDISAMDIYFAKTNDSASGGSGATQPALLTGTVNTHQDTWMELSLAVEQKQ